MSEWDDDTIERLVRELREVVDLLVEIRDHPLIPRCGFDDCTEDALLAKIEGGEA